MVEKMKNKRVVTLSLNDKVYEEYKAYCDKEGFVLSKQVEKFMIDELNKNKRNQK